MENLPLEAVLLNRNLIGLEFTQACEYASRYFLEHFAPELRGQGDRVAELMILSKGLYYWFHNAFAAVYEENLPINFVATNRVDVRPESVDIRVSYRNFDAAAESLLIGDTIASGETICAALGAYLESCELRDVYIFTIAGSQVGIRRIGKFCQDNGIRLHVVFGLAVFGLGQNGFDLSFLHPDTVTRQDYRNRAAELYDGLPLSAAGWDFGSQAQAPRKYRMLSWLEAHKWGIEGRSILREIEEPAVPALIQKEEAAFRLLPRSRAETPASTDEIRTDNDSLPGGY
jgi:hypothetical protein